MRSLDGRADMLRVCILVGLLSQCVRAQQCRLSVYAAASAQDVVCDMKAY